MLDRVQFSTGAAVGGAGAATATAYSPHVRGKVLAVHVDYVGSPPNTTDFTLSDEGDPAAESILTLTNANTDVRHYPRRQVQTNAGADIAAEYDRYVVHDRLKAVIAQANAGDSVTVTVWLEQQ